MVERILTEFLFLCSGSSQFFHRMTPDYAVASLADYLDIRDKAISVKVRGSLASRSSAATPSAWRATPGNILPSSNTVFTVGTGLFECLGIAPYLDHVLDITALPFLRN